MKHLITLLLLALSINSNAQSCNADAAGISGYTIPVFAVIERTPTGNDTPCWYMNRAEIIAYVASAAGSVTTLSSGNLSPIFTSSVANATTTPAISYTLSNAAAYTVLTNSTNATAAPAYAKVDPLALKNNGGTANSSTYYRGDGQWATPAGGGADSVFTATVWVSSAEILDISATPKTLVAAPGAGKIIVPIKIIWSYTFVATAYSSTQMSVYSDANTNSEICRLVGARVASTSSIITEFTFPQVTGQGGIYVANAPLILSGSSSPGTGDGTAVAVIVYRVINIP